MTSWYGKYLGTSTDASPVIMQHVMKVDCKVEDPLIAHILTPNECSYTCMMHKEQVNFSEFSY